MKKDIGIDKAGRCGRLATLCLGLLLALAAAAEATPLEELRGWVDDKAENGDLLAVSAAWLDGGEVSDLAGGVVTGGSSEAPGPGTRFQIGSITKAFTDLLLAELVAEGRVGYDTTIGAILGEDFEFRNEAVGAITLQELATHTSGLPRLPGNLVMMDPLDPYKGYGEQELRNGIAAARDKQPLAKAYSYSNFGVGLLGYLLGQVHGGGYEAALQEKVLDPLGLTDTAFVPGDTAANGYRNGEVVPDWDLAALAGAGALWSTTADLMKLARAYLSAERREVGGEAPLKHPLSQDLEIVASGPASFDVTRVWHVGHAGDAPIYWHNGGTGGFLSFFGFRPDTDQAVAILVAGGEDVTGLGLKLLGHERREQTQTAAPIDPQLPGQYRISESFGIGVFERDGQLIGQASGQPALPLIPIEADWYAVTAADASLHFLREDGNVVAVELVQNGLVQRGEKVADVAASEARQAREKSREDLAAFVGEYAINSQAKFTIRLGEEHLEAQITGQPFFPIYADEEDDVFFYKVVEAELHFERDEDGAVNALVLHQGAIVQRAERID